MDGDFYRKLLDDAAKGIGCLIITGLLGIIGTITGIVFAILYFMK